VRVEISLIRHGQSIFQEKEKITNAQFIDWVKGYDEHGVVQEKQYPKEAMDRIKQSNIIITSDLIRSKESATYLSPNGTFTSNSLFREVELPVSKRKWMGMRLKPFVWLVIYRILWVLGYSNECESYHEANLRARKAAESLIELASKHERVSLVGHGIFNRLIAKELQAQGWEGMRKFSSKHWSCTTYRKVG